MPALPPVVSVCAGDETGRTMLRHLWLTPEQAAALAARLHDYAEQPR